MIILDSTTESLEILLAGAVTTNQLPFTASYADHNATAPSFTPGSSDGQTNNTTAVTLVGNPGAGVQRQVKRLNVYNADTAQATVTVRLNNGGTLRTQFSIVLQTGERIEYEDGKGFSVYTVTGAQKVTAVQSTVEPGYIDGLRMVWNSTNSITVTAGTAYIPSVGANVNLPSDDLNAGLGLAASTWYHVYLYLNSGVPDIEIVTTAPASPYNGEARTKTADTSRRYVGSFRTDSGALIKPFKHLPQSGEVLYGANVDFVLSNGVATVSTAVDCSPNIPVTATAVKLLMGNGDTVNFAYYSGDPATSVNTTTNYAGVIPPNNNLSPDVPVNSSQQFFYMFNAAPAANGLFCRAFGYKYGR